MSRARTRPQAEADLFDIALYIARDDPSASDRFLDGFERTFQLLATTPDMGRARPELGQGLRSFPVGRYVIFYRSRHDGIDIVRVLSASRDIPSLF